MADPSRLRPTRPAAAAPEGAASVYALQLPLLIGGAVAAAVALALQGPLVAFAVLSLFALVGASWRTDMIPILPACIAFQWLGASSCYIFYRNFGYPPGGGYADGLPIALVASMVGLAALVLGLRTGFTVFNRTITEKTMAAPLDYDLRRVFLLTLAAFTLSYLINIVPTQLWYSGAQIITNLLELRFVPYFLLLVAVFERRAGYQYAFLATLWVLGPQLLTGFSDFKEILLVIIVAALAQWRPWIRTVEQRRQNLFILTVGMVGAVFAVAAAILWSGGVKQEWRQIVWSQQGAQASPLEKIGLFGRVMDHVMSNFDVKHGAEMLAARSSSGELYLSYVMTRVPQMVPHEGGKLFMRAVENATSPRVLFPEKASLGGDSWLVRKYAGLHAAGDESGASIGLGYFAEFYVDFGWAGIVGLGFLWGVIAASALSLLARVSPSREVFMAVSVGIAVGYLMVFDASFIKLLAGLIQRTAIVAIVIGIVGPTVLAWMLRRPGGPRSPWARQPAAGRAL